MSQFTQTETETIRNGAMGAIALVSQAEPGFLATFKESMAASKALAGAPAEFQQVMKSGMSLPPTASSKAEMEDELVENLRQAVATAGRDQATAQALKAYVLAACQQVAEAAKGVSPEESAMIERIRGVLDQAPADAGAQEPAVPTPQPADPQADPAQAQDVAEETPATDPAVAGTTADSTGDGATLQWPGDKA